MKSFSLFTAISVMIFAVTFLTSTSRGDEFQKGAPVSSQPSVAPAFETSTPITPNSSPVIPNSSPVIPSSDASAGDAAPLYQGPVRFYKRRYRPPAETKFYNGYLGIEGGLALASGTYLPLNSGLAYGINMGIDTPILGFGLIARHESLSVWNTNSKESITQMMLELNIFSYLLLNGGIQAGDIITNLDGGSTNSLGLGFHLGVDLHVTKELTAGLGAYWTYVTQNSDKHSLFNIMIPVRYWF